MAIHKAIPIPSRFTMSKPRDKSTFSGGRVRVGLITPSLQLGGAEQWIIELLKATNHDLIEWVEVSLVYSVNAALDTIQTVSQICPVSMGWQAAASLNKKCDVVIVWGIGDAGTFFWPDKFCKVILVSHGMGKWTEKSFTGCSFADAHVAVSQCALKPIPKAERHKASVIYNAVNSERLKPQQTRNAIRQRWGVKDNQKVLGYLGRLSGEKNPKALAKAMKYLPPEWVGVAVGDGLQADEVKRVAAKTAGDRVKFPGKTDDVGGVLQAFDAFLSPSFEEACSLALIEAWMAKVPAIATPVGMVLEQPDLVAKLPRRANGKQIAKVVLKDFKNKKAQAQRVKKAFDFADKNLSVKTFGANWTEHLLKVAKGDK